MLAHSLTDCMILLQYNGVCSAHQNYSAFPFTSRAFLWPAAGWWCRWLYRLEMRSSKHRLGRIHAFGARSRRLIQTSTVARRVVDDANPNAIQESKKARSLAASVLSVSATLSAFLVFSVASASFLVKTVSSNFCTRDSRLPTNPEGVAFASPGKVSTTTSAAGNNARSQKQLRWICRRQKALEGE